MSSKINKKINPKLKSIKILDPFAGSGNLIFEPSRLQMDSHASDYNPLSYLILKSVLEFSSNISKYRR